MAKKITRSRPWTKEEVRVLKWHARDEHRVASKLGVMLGGGQKKRA